MATPPAAPSRSVYALAYPVYLVLQGVLIAALFAFAPRQFWLDDSQAQFAPTAWWLGVLGRGGAPALVDPDMGAAGNFTVDMQYGALDPLHWMLSAAAAATNDLLLLSWVFAALTMVILGSGLFVLLARHGANPFLVVAASLGVTSTGFLLWFGSTWWPVLWSICWIPWLWWALSARTRIAVPLAFLSTWAVFAGGNPYLLPFAGVLMIVLLLAAVREEGGWKGLVHSRTTLATIIASVGGFLVATPTLLTALQLAPFMSREEPEPNIGNSGFAVPNIIDFAMSGTTALPAANWIGTITYTPAFAIALFVLPLLALVDWRAAVRMPVVWAPLTLVVMALLLSQLPTTFAIFRYPLRHAGVYHLALVVLAVIAFTRAPAVTRSRVILAAVLVGVQGYLAFMRAPVLVRWNILGALLAIAVLVAVVVLATTRLRRSVRIAAASVVVVLTLLPPLVQVLEMSALRDRLVAEGSTPSDAGPVHRAVPDGAGWGTTVEEMRADSVAPDSAVSIINTDGYGTQQDRGTETGVLIGNGGLFAQMRTGVGYAAAQQKHLNEYVTSDLWGRIFSPDAETWLEEVPDTGQAFIDLYAADRVILQGAGQEELREHLDTSPLWSAGEPAGPEALSTYERVTPLISRVTWADGVEVSPEGATADAARLGGSAEEAFRVSSGAEDGFVVLRVPYWPGYTATIDGADATVVAVDDALVGVEIPAGLDDALVEVRYAPTGVRLFTVLLGTAGALLVAAVVVSFLPRRRNEDARA